MYKGEFDNVYEEGIHMLHNHLTKSVNVCWKITHKGLCEYYLFKSDTWSLWSAQSCNYNKVNNSPPFGLTVSMKFMNQH